MRFLAAPWVSMLESGAWLRYGAHANACAKDFARKIADLPQLSLMFKVEANAVFLKMPATVADGLRERGWLFYTFIGGGARFMFAWDSSEESVNALVEDLRSLCG